MNTTIVKESQFLLRRIAESMPPLALLVPVLFAFIVLLCIIAFRRKRKLLVFGIGSTVIVGGALLYGAVGYALRESVSWWLVLVPTLLVGLVYICVMYVRDAHSVHWAWAAFLGLLRFSVYCLLGICFLLPSCQDYDITINESKVLMLFDVSGSTDAVDGQEGEGGITRQEKIARFLTTAYPQGSTTKTFVEYLTDSSPVVAYRFGAVADDEGVVFDGKKKAWTAEEWRRWFRPDKIEKKDIVVPTSITDDKQVETYRQTKLGLYAQLREGTDVGGSALQIVQREGSSRIQAIYVFSDGNSNRGDEEAIRQLLERAGNLKRPIHIITVGVGDYKQPVRIRINPLVAPQAVRPDDGPFEVRVPVFGDGLAGEEFEVTLEAQRVKDRNGVELKKEPVYTVGKQKGKFGGGGEFPYDEVVFKVNLEQLTKIKAGEDSKNRLLGQWNFIAKLPRHSREAADPTKPEHASQAKPVMVNDNTLRVLLFASGPYRDFIFARTLLAREVDAKRARLSVYLQTAKGLEDVQQDVDGSHLLHDFPSKLERPKGAKKGDKGDASKEGDPMNLKSYDVIIAFDPDWSQLSKIQKELLKEWVDGEHGGGIIFVAGPVHMLRLIPPVDEAKLKAWDLQPIYSLFPVILGRPPANVQAESLHDATIPYTLDFTGIAKGFDFIKLDEDSPAPLAGWKEFFGKSVVTDFPGGKKVHPERGFHSYYRITKAKDGAEVIATFNDPKAPKTVDGKAQPFYVSLRIGKGKSFYIGSDEMWRLRTFKEEYLQRFWIKLARYVSSGSGAKTFGHFAMAGEYVTGIIPIEAEVRDKDGFPQSPDTPPVVVVRKAGGSDVKEEKLPTVQLRPKKGPGKFAGVFAGSVRLDKEGSYEVRIDIPGTEESISQTFEVKSPNIEMADLRTNFPKLYNMATEATLAMLNRLDADTRQRLEAGRDRPKGGADSKVETAGGARLFFRLANAQPTSQLITHVRPEEEKVKGAIRDLWDQGPEVYNAQSWHHVPVLAWAMFLVPAAVTLVVMILMLIGKRWLAALGLLVALALIEAAMVGVIARTTPEELFRPSSYGVLLVVPTLICLTAAGILLLAERYYWVVTVLVGMVAYLGILLAVQWIFEPEWWPMKVDFTWMLLSIGLLLSAEWFTRKMLRLA
jgi:hypothetical protein